MKWEDAFSVGIPEIDQQHLVIVECISLVEEAVASNNAKNRWMAVHSALGRLSDYVRIHFAVEESLMRIHGYPEFARHLDEHRAFAFDLHRMQEKSLKADVSEEMAATLGKWLHEHIMISDRQYADYLLYAGLATRAAHTGANG